jgi:hypothetical protein
VIGLSLQSVGHPIRAFGDHSREIVMSSRSISRSGGVVLGTVSLLLAACGTNTATTNQNTASPATPSSVTAAPRTSTPAKPTATAPTTKPAPAPTSTATIVSSRVAHDWQWAVPGNPAKVVHTQTVPPVPTLIRIIVASHTDLGSPVFDRASFTFTGGFPSYQYNWESPADFVGDASGQKVPIAGDDIVKIAFTTAQAHTNAGQSTVMPRGANVHTALGEIVAYANAGDFEGHLVYGLGTHRWVLHSNPRTRVRAVETVMIVNGRRQYTIAFDVEAAH